MAPKVMTTAGAVAGVTEQHGRANVDVFRGVPFAEPPARFRPAVPARPWTGTRSALAFGSAAPQTPMAPVGLPAAAMEVGTDIDEAGCLTLNVWAPAGARACPVLVWFHGGSFVTGSSSMASYDGATLAAEESVVVVSANYRLGALGFAPLAGCANVGLLDQLLALEWVAENAEAFGGDAGRVTAFGESAGGGAILHLLDRAAGRSLVHRAIVQSGATDLTIEADVAEEAADRMRTALAGADPLLAPIGALLDAQSQVLAAMAGRDVMAFHPTVDGAVVRARPAETMAGVAGAGVDLLIGTTRDEMTPFLDPATWELGPERLAKRAARYLAGHGVEGAAAEAMLAAYGDRSPSQAWSALRTDAEMWLPMLAVAEAHAGARWAGPGVGRPPGGATAGRTFVYRFDWPAAPPQSRLGACHGIDIPFTFGALDRCGWNDFVGAGPEAAALSRAIRHAWATFAASGHPASGHPASGHPASGHPASGELPAWPGYDATRPTMVLDRRPSLAHDPEQRRRRAWQAAASGTYSSCK